MTRKIMAKGMPATERNMTIAEIVVTNTSSSTKLPKFMEVKNLIVSETLVNKP